MSAFRPWTSTLPCIIWFWYEKPLVRFPCPEFKHILEVKVIGIPMYVHIDDFNV
jgi:hypothetical protein